MIDAKELEEITPEYFGGGYSGLEIKDVYKAGFKKAMSMLAEQWPNEDEMRKAMKKFMGDDTEFSGSWFLWSEWLRDRFFKTKDKLI